MNVTENAPRFVLFDGCKELDVERVWAKERCSVRQEEIGRGCFILVTVWCTVAPECVSASALFAGAVWFCLNAVNIVLIGMH